MNMPTQGVGVGGGVLGGGGVGGLGSRGCGGGGGGGGCGLWALMGKAVDRLNCVYTNPFHGGRET